MILNRLLNADGATVGYFTDDEAGRATMQAARVEWDAHGATGALVLAQRAGRAVVCRSVATPIKPLELEDVELGDDDRMDYCIQEHPTTARMNGVTADTVSAWGLMGAADVVTQRYEINRYRRPNKSNRSADLGGPVSSCSSCPAARGVLYVLIIKAPK